MEIRYLQTFLVVVEEANLTAAAEKLNYSQPNVSMHLKQLQKEVGAPLFIIKGNKRYLTPAGEIVKKYSERILSNLELMKSEIADMNGTLTIAAPEYFCTCYLPRIVKTFKNKFPKLLFEVSSGNSDKTFESVVNHESDIGIVIGKKLTTELHGITIGHDDLIMIGSAELADRYSKSELLHRYPIFADNHLEFIKHRIDDLFSEWNLVSCTSEEMIGQAVLNKEGLGILGSRRLKEHIEQNRVKVIETYAENVEVKLICLKERQSEPKISAFFELMSEAYLNEVLK